MRKLYEENNNEMVFLKMRDVEKEKNRRKEKREIERGR